MNPSSPENSQSAPERVFLTGFMGAGKSTIGRLLATRVGYKFYDTDRLVVKGFRKSVSRIFYENGEQAFRDAEILVLHELARRSNIIVSTGGGTLVREDALTIAQNAGPIVYLRAPLKDLFERVVFSPKDRPILDAPDTEAVFRERFHERTPFYERSDVTVDTADRKPIDVVDEIIMRLALKELSHG